MDMAQWMRKISDSEACDIAVAIEVNHGPVVESLVECGFSVYSINPKQLDRFRDRFCVSGAKDDRRDALVLASALRTDRGHFRRIEPQDSDVIELRELGRTREELVAERARLVNRFHGLLWRYYPQFGELLGEEVKPWHTELWELVPSPDSVKRKRVSTVKELLKRHRVRRLSAEKVLEVLRCEKINVNEATVESCVMHTRSVVERINLADRQIREIEVSIKKVIERINLRLKAEKEGPTDIEILLSVPGIGNTVLATMIGEGWNLIERRDRGALRCLGGAAPVTKQSGKTKYVVRRMAVCRRLADALVVLGKVAAIYDPLSKAKYKELRRRGHSHYTAVRTVTDRLLSVICSILDKGELFDKEFRKPWKDAVA